MKYRFAGRSLDLGSNPSKLVLDRWLGRWSPEPETVSWISDMKPNEIFFDVGANIGRFSMMAAACGLTVYAFEPVIANYQELVALTKLNDLKIMAFPAAVSDRIRLGSIGAGRSTATFYDYAFAPQGVMTISLNAFCSTMGVYPDHVKIDVDGDEPKILQGMCLVWSHVKSVLVEVDPHVEEHHTIVPFFANKGFQCYRGPVVDGGKYDGLSNHLFVRERNGETLIPSDNYWVQL